MQTPHTHTRQGSTRASAPHFLVCAPAAGTLTAKRPGDCATAPSAPPPPRREERSREGIAAHATRAAQGSAWRLTLMRALPRSVARTIHVPVLTGASRMNTLSARYTCAIRTRHARNTTPQHARASPQAHRHGVPPPLLPRCRSFAAPKVAASTVHARYAHDRRSRGRACRRRRRRPESKPRPCRCSARGSPAPAAPAPPGSWPS